MFFKTIFLFLFLLLTLRTVWSDDHDSMISFRDQIRKIKTQLKNRSDEVDKDCPICFQPYAGNNEEKERRVVVPACGHLVCEDCFHKLSDKSCPICRRRFLGAYPVLLNANGKKDFITKLLVQPERPSIHQVRDVLARHAVPNLRDISELSSADHQNDYSYWFEILAEESPYLIASLEKAFPGATWAFIGRDMAVFADLFEAFYRSLGQEERVVRVNMSRETLADITPDLAMKLLKTIGFQTDLKYPFIFIDSISKNGGQQGRTLIDAIYRAISHISLSELLFKVNFVGLPTGTSRIPEAPLSQVSSILTSEAAKYRKRSRLDFFSEHKILTYSDRNREPRFLSYVGNEKSIGTWTEPYGKLEERDGKVAAQLGTASSPKVRNALLVYQAHIVKLGFSQEFLQNVKDAASDLGYQFPLSRTELPRELVLEAEPEKTSPSCFKSFLIKIFGEERRVYHLDRDWNSGI